MRGSYRIIYTKNRPRPVVLLLPSGNFTFCLLETLGSNPDAAHPPLLLGMFSDQTAACALVPHLSGAFLSVAARAGAGGWCAGGMGNAGAAARVDLKRDPVYSLGGLGPKFELRQKRRKDDSDYGLFFLVACLIKSLSCPV